MNNSLMEDYEWRVESGELIVEGTNSLREFELYVLNGCCFVILAAFLIMNDMSGKL